MFSKKFPFYKQLDQMDCGPTCLYMIAKHHGKIFPMNYLREKSNVARDGVTMGGIAEAAEAIGLASLAVNANYDTLLNEVPLPCIAYWKQRHFIIIYSVEKNNISIADPAFGLLNYTKEEFLKGWIPDKKNKEEGEGVLLILEPTANFHEQEIKEQVKKRDLNFLIPYFKPYFKYIIQLFLGLIVGSCLQLVFPFLAKSVVDQGINTQNIHFIYIVLIAQLTLFLSQTSVGIIRSWILLHITSRINIRMLSDFLIKLMNLPIAFFDSKNIGDLLQRIQDHNRVQNFVSASTLDILFSIVNLVVFGIVLCLFKIKIFFIFLIGSAFYILWVLLFMKKRVEIDYKRFDEAAGNQSSTIQLINGMQEIKLSGSERKRRWEWEAIQARLFKLSFKSLALTQTQDIGANFINEIKNIIISFVAAKAVIDGEITLGIMLAVQYIIGQLNLPINNFLSFIRNYQDAKISLNRLTEIHSKENEEKSNETYYSGDFVKDKDICFKNVDYRYGSKAAPLIIKNIDLLIPSGKVTAIVGASGSGKTTLIKLLLKFYAPESGNINIGNINFMNISARQWRSVCGVVMQEAFIFSDSILRNIAESDNVGVIDKKRLSEAVRIANIQEFIESLPMGYNTRIGASGMNLSGGQKQRIMIARAVYKNPDYLFFDEATSSLDANNEKIIMNNLEEYYRGRTVVVVAHRLSTVKNADQIIVLDKGNIVETGSHASLIEMKGEYYRLIKNQLELGN